MKRTVIYLLFASLTIIILSCHKNESNKYYNTQYINSNIKSLFFKTGSYWIYIDDSLNQIDSTFISGTKSGFYEVGTGLNSYTEYEYYSMNFKSHYSNWTKSSGQLFIDRTHMLINPVVGYPWAWGYILYSVDTIREQVIYHDSLNGKYYKFYHVQECSFKSRYYWGDTLFTYYTEPDIGIVKKIITVDSVTTIWNLKKWEIVK